MSRNTFRGGNVLQKRITKQNFGRPRRTSATFAVFKFYLSEATLLDELRFSKNATFFERCKTSGKTRTCDASFSAGFSKTIPRVSTRVLRKDFILANVFCFDSLSGFEPKILDICLKKCQHAGQSCFLFVRNHILGNK